MKLFLASLLLSTVAFAAPKVVEPGSYTAIDNETKTIVAALEIRADHTMNFKVKSPDFTMPDPGCEGQWTIVQENLFSADLKCPLDFLSEVQVQIDINKVTSESVRAPEGVDVDVTIDALGADAFSFNLRKVK